MGVIAGLLSMASAAWADALFNQQWGFRTTYPEGWQVQQFAPGPLVVQAIPPGETLVNCNTTAASVPETKDMTQEVINSEVAPEQLNEQF
jgi:hypothetical protein